MTLPRPLPAAPASSPRARPANTERAQVHAPPAAPALPPPVPTPGRPAAPGTSELSVVLRVHPGRQPTIEVTVPARAVSPDLAVAQAEQQLAAAVQAWLRALTRAR